MKNLWRFVAAGVIGAVVLSLAISLFSGRGLARNLEASAPISYAGASETVVPASLPDTEIPLSQQRVGKPQSAPAGKTGITPPVTVDTVRSFVAAHPLNVMSVAVQDLSVTNIQFTTAGALRAALDDPLWDMWAKDYPMVYVSFSGDFLVSPIGSEQSDKYTFGYRVFDARTGNELQSGVGPARTIK